MYFYGLGRVFEYFCDISRFSQRRKQFSDFEKEFFLRKQARRSVMAQEGSRRDGIYERIGWLHNLQPFSYLDVKQASISHCCYSTAVEVDKQLFWFSLSSSAIPIFHSLSGLPSRSATTQQTIAHSKVVTVVAFESIFRFRWAKKKWRKKFANPSAR